MSRPHLRGAECSLDQVYVQMSGMVTNIPRALSESAAHIRQYVWMAQARIGAVMGAYLERSFHQSSELEVSMLLASIHGPITSWLHESHLVGVTLMVMSSWAARN